jgi:NTE family protein
MACSSQVRYLNKPLSEADKSHLLPSYFEAHDRNDDITVILTFSGGGTRAAAFSYGVMKGLREQKVTINSRHSTDLLSLVDMISSVSGGSFTAAYYGLFGDRLFTDYEQDFLKLKVQSYLTRQLLINPINWFRFMSGQFNRSELTAQYYQRQIFGGKTFADMRPEAPAIMINATDIATGSGFSFTEEHFRWLCSDLSEFPVGKAVTASSAVPVLFSPVLVKNHGGCEPYEFQLNRVHDDVRFKHQALKLRQFRQKHQYPYLHLVDGGVADNLGVRSLLNQVYEQDNDFWQALKAYRLTNTKKVLFVVVNAAAVLDESISQSIDTPSLAQTLNAVTTIQSQNYNDDTLDLLELSVDQWVDQVREGRCVEFFKEGCDDFNFYVTELNFSHIGEPHSSELAAIETALQLPEQQVDRLIRAGEQLVRESEVIQRFVADVNGD